LTDVASLLQTGRRKFGVIVKAALKFLHALQPTSVNQSGSHRVFHFGQSGPVTLVLPHTGSRSKDGTVSQRYCTQLYKAMQQATMSQFGPMHSAAAAPQVQAQAQMQLPAAESSSASVALTEFD
jgi:predicted RNA binding protein YcfA (HicA-like mRNA interferase family)